MAENIPHASIGFVESLLAVNFENISRPGHGDVDNIPYFSRPVRHDHDSISKRHCFYQIVGEEYYGLAFLLPDL